MRRKRKTKKSRNLLLVIFFIIAGISVFSFILYTGTDTNISISELLKQFDAEHIPYQMVNSTTVNLSPNRDYLKKVERIISHLDIEIDRIDRSDKSISIILKKNDVEIGSLIINKEKVVNKKESQNNIAANSTFLEEKFNKICIILDDGGYGNSNIYKIVKYPEKLAVAVLPFLPKSKEISQLVYNNGKEVMLHMPMEPKNYKERHIRLFKNDLLISMDKYTINENISKMLNSVNYVRGVNNHQGSGFTENKEKMRIVLKRLKKENLFFIDSLTSGKSVSEKIADEVGVLLGKRDVFLDNKDDYDYIKNQMNKLIRIAERRGYAVGIGHVQKSNTVKVLYDYIKVFKNNNIKLVYPSELLMKIHNKEVI